MTRDELERRFTYRPPTEPKIRSAHEAAREIVTTAARALNGITPDCREQSLMMTALEESLFWANAAIARQKS